MYNEFNLEVKPIWSEVERVILATRDYLTECGFPENSVDTYTMVACELVENGIKYGQYESPEDGYVDVTIDISDAVITVQVQNRLKEENTYHLRQLDKTLQWIRGFQDPFQAYVERLKQISRESSDQNKSGLGIVRIAYEAKATIDFIVGEDETLQVVAVSHIN